MIDYFLKTILFYANIGTSFSSNFNNKTTSVAIDYNKILDLITLLIMKIEYNNLYTHFVFTTFNRMPIILEQFRDRIEKYITGIVNNNGCKMYSIYANPEHVHFLISRSPQLDEESLTTIIANSSEKFINDNRLCVGIFQWQQSCSAFSVSKRNVHELCEYIENQKEHHKTKSYAEEYEGYVKFYQQTIRKRTKK
jgi:REP element-mobilizing transposase RayT